MHPEDLSRTLSRLPSASMTAVGSAGGFALGAAVAAVAVLRNVPKPLHPRGRYSAATVTRFGSPRQSGVSWIDGTGTNAAVVRHSGAIGFPLGLPDVQGIAVQVEVEGSGHLLFANTGLGRISRYVLTGSSRIDGRPYTTLLPYRGPRGPILLGLKPQSPTLMTMLWAPGSGAWQEFGTLALTGPHNGPPISFDPMLRTLPELVPYPWVRALRAPAYRVARNHRGEDLRQPGAGAQVADVPVLQLVAER